MSGIETTKDIDLVKIVDNVWKENDLHSGVYKIAALTAMQELQDLYEKRMKQQQEQSELLSCDTCEYGKYKQHSVCTRCFARDKHILVT